MKTQPSSRILGLRFLGLGMFLAAMVCFGGPLAPAHADEDSKKEALAWIDSYSKVQVLFSDKDVERVRKKLEDASPEKATEWMERTAELRETLNSKEWKETRDWLDDFMKVQAIYSDEQIEKFRKEAAEDAKKSPKKLVDILKEIEAKRQALISGSATSAQLRTKQVELNKAYAQEATAQRDTIRQAKVDAFAASSQANKQQQVHPRTYTRPGHLVDSMDVARWSVMNNFLPRW